jgi:hypothetical protein
LCKTEGLYNSNCVEWFLQNHSDDGLYDVSHYVKFHCGPCISKIMTCWNQIKYGNTIPHFATKNPVDRLNQLEIWCDLKELLSMVQHFYIWPLHILNSRKHKPGYFCCFGARHVLISCTVVVLCTIWTPPRRLVLFFVAIKRNTMSLRFLEKKNNLSNHLCCRSWNKGTY